MRHFRLIAAGLALSLALSVPAYAVPIQEEAPLFPAIREYKVPLADAEASWCRDAVKTCYEMDLMQGKTETLFAPTAPLTYAQVSVIAARLYARLTNSEMPTSRPGETWYQGALDLLDTLDDAPALLRPITETPNDPCRRQDFAQLLLLVLQGAKVQLPVRNNLNQATPDLLPTDSVYPLYRAGILVGTDQYGTFNGQGTLNRGQAAVMLARTVNPAERLTATLKSLDLCQDILGLSPDTVVMTIDGRNITADQFTWAICRELRTQYNKMICDGPQANNLKGALDSAAHSMKLDLAIEQLSAKRGISHSPETFSAGYRGLSAAAGAWVLNHTGLYQELLAIYLEEHGSASAGASPHAVPWGQECLDSELSDRADKMELVFSEALTALDLSAAQTRLVEAPGHLG